MSVTPFMDTGSLLKDLGFSGLLRSLGEELSSASDILETQESFELYVDMPGHDPKSIEVKVEGTTLTITSERKLEADEKKAHLLRERSFGLFTLTFVLPSGIDSTRVDARYENGVLAVSVPKREDAKPRTITIKGIEGQSEQKQLGS